MDDSTRFKDLVDGRRIPPHLINVLLFARGVASAPRRIRNNPSKSTTYLAERALKIYQQLLTTNLG